MFLWVQPLLYCLLWACKYFLNNLIHIFSSRIGFTHVPLTDFLIILFYAFFYDFFVIWTGIVYISSFEFILNLCWLDWKCKLIVKCILIYYVRSIREDLVITLMINYLFLLIYRRIFNIWPLLRINLIFKYLAIIFRSPFTDRILIP